MIWTYVFLENPSISHKKANLFRRVASFAKLTMKFGSVIIWLLMVSLDCWRLIRALYLSCSSGRRSLTKTEFLGAVGSNGKMPVAFAADMQLARVHEQRQASRKLEMHANLNFAMFEASVVFANAFLSSFLKRCEKPCFKGLAKPTSNICSTCVVWLGKIKTSIRAFRQRERASGFSRDVCPSIINRT